MINVKENIPFIKKRLISSPQIEPLSGLLEGGTTVTISGSNLGQKAEDILHSVSVAGVPCAVIPSLYEVSSRYRQDLYLMSVFMPLF